MIRSARAVPLVVALLFLAPRPVRGACTQSVLPVFQCGFASWFLPPPGGSGAVSAVWWQLGYGNGDVSNGAGTPADEEGTGMAPAGVFSGNDSGLNVPFLSLADDQLPQYAPQIPDGSLCMGYSTWADTGVDGCADVPRTTSVNDNDNLLNPYWGIPYGPCPSPPLCAPPYYTTAYQLDYPIAVLLRETTNRYFALVFVASRSRGHDGTDVSEGLYDLSEVTNGAPNPVFPARSNVIFWQPVPLPSVTGVTGDPGPPWNVSLSWLNVKLVHDASTRPNARLVGAGLAGGVGVTEQGSLVRYRIETAPLAPGDPNAQTLTWTPGATFAAPAGVDVTAQIQIAGRTAVRVRTLLGKTPRTTATSLSACRAGACGDLGFEATRCGAAGCPGPPPFSVVDIGCADQDDDGYTACEECLDTSAAVHPGAPQLCDGLNNDCNAPGWPSTAGTNEADDDLDGVSECQGDCADDNPARRPGLAETCNAIDDDCDGVVDETAAGVDSDADGVRNACDNCVSDANPGQEDRDTDGQGDECDLNDGLILITFANATQVRYQLESGYDTYNIYRGNVAVMAQSGVYTQDPAVVPLATRFCGQTGGLLTDAVVPPVGSIVFHMTTGKTAGGTESGLGTTSGGAPRPNTLPCP
ncbi:MAG: putative metal-binding motif-containing protein [Candidatus Polarisedimenticolia bacterium]